MSVATAIFLLTLDLVVAAMMAWFLGKGLSTGTLENRYNSFVRSSRPVAFWVSAIIYAVGLALSASIAIYLLGEIFGSWR